MEVELREEREQFLMTCLSCNLHTGLAIYVSEDSPSPVSQFELHFLSSFNKGHS